MSDSLSMTSENTGGPDSWAHRGDVTGTVLPLVVSAFQDSQQRHKSHKLQNLPSHRFRYSVWHDLRGASLRGSEIKAPRVRDGPETKEEFFYKLRNENEEKIHHSKKGTERRKYQDEAENWGEAKKINLSYQDLDHRYQHPTLLRVVGKLRQAEHIQLLEDGLLDLSSVSLPRCISLNLSRNHISTFKGLPQIPNIKVLNISHNDIKTVDGIACLSGTTIEHLILKGNPLAYTLNYRQTLFQQLPQILTLDGVKCQLEDTNFHTDPGSKSACVVC